MKPAPPDPPEIAHLLWGPVRPARTGWDVGANCGQTLPYMLQRFDTVIAFEPATECLPYLNRHPVLVIDAAISDTDGTVTLAALPDKIDTGQLVTPGTAGMEWNPDQPTAELRTVTCHTLDTLTTALGPPDFIKVDVEGHEGKVLTGAGHLLTHHKPGWLIEFHSPQLYDVCTTILTDFGYTPHTVRHPHYPPGSPMWHQHGWIHATAPAR